MVRELSVMCEVYGMVTSSAIDIAIGSLANMYLHTSWLRAGNVWNLSTGKELPCMR